MEANEIHQRRSPVSQRRSQTQRPVSAHHVLTHY
jgi:hypothetical protein